MIETLRSLQAATVAAALLLAAGCGGVSDVELDGAPPASDGNAADAPPSDGEAPVSFPDDALLHLELTGDYADSSGNGNDGAAIFSAQDELFGADRFNMAVSALDLRENLGNNWYNLVEVPALDLGGEITIAAWILADPMNNDERIAGQGDWFNLLFQGQNAAFAPTDLGTGGPAAIDPDAHDEASWVFYAGVVEVSENLETTMKLYRDGELKAEATADEVFNAPDCSFYVGHFRENAPTQCTGVDDDGQVFPGLVDDVRVFDRALSVEEIGLLYGEDGWPESAP